MGYFRREPVQGTDRLVSSQCSSGRPWFEARRRSRTGSSMPPLELKMAGMDEGEDEPAVPLRRSHGIQYIRRFYATKNSWKGKYARIFCICEKSVLTLNPTTFDVTNEWTYAHDLVEVTCTGIDTHEFSITVRKAEGKTSMLSKSTTKISFSCEHRAALVTALQMAKVAALESPAEGQPVKAPKSPVAKPAFAGAALTKDGNFLPLALVVCPWALELRMMAAKPPGPEAEAAAAAAAADDSAVSLASISYENFEAVRAVRQEGGGAGSSSPIAFVLHHGVGRVAILSCERRRDLLTAVTKAAAVLGIGICIGSELGVTATPPGSISERARGAVEQAIAWGGTADGQPLGPHASSRVAIAMARGIEEEELLAPIFEAPVIAFSSDYDDLRTPAPRPNAARTIILTDTAIVEKDPNRMLVTSCRPLAEVARWPSPPSFAPPPFPHSPATSSCRPATVPRNASPPPSPAPPSPTTTSLTRPRPRPLPLVAPVPPSHSCTLSCATRVTSKPSHANTLRAACAAMWPPRATRSSHRSSRPRTRPATAACTCSRTRTRASRSRCACTRSRCAPMPTSRPSI